MKLNLRLLLMAVASLVDDALIIIVLVWVLSRLGVGTPWWSILILALIFLTWGLINYRALLKNPTLGFENVLGKTGVTVGLLKPKGTVRIGRELWQARSAEAIEAGTPVKVVSQSGLNLTVVSQTGQNAGRESTDT